MTPHDVPEAVADTYPMPEHGWTCFHCGETFTSIGYARKHFGATPDAVPGCLLKVSPGAEHALLHVVRELEERLAKYMEEDTALHRAMHAQQHRHAEGLRYAEIAGYERGLRDAALPLIDQHRGGIPESPQTVTTTKMVCDGCPHLHTEHWRDHLDNDETDSGTRATCTKAGRNITPYWHEWDRSPSWCPMLAPASGEGVGDGR